MHISLLTPALPGIRIAELDHPLLRVVELTAGALETMTRTLPELATGGVYLLMDPTGAQPLGVGAATDLSLLLETWRVAEIQLPPAVVLLTGRFRHLSEPEIQSLVGFAQQTLVPSGTYPVRAFAEDAPLCSAALALWQALGYRFAPLPAPIEDGLFYCSAGPVSGRARREDRAFVVLCGSTGRRAPAHGVDEAAQLQQALIQAGVVRAESGRLIFTRDQRFDSAALAGTALLGRVSSGFFDWKTATGLSYGQIERFIDDAEEPGTLAP